MDGWVNRQVPNVFLRSALLQSQTRCDVVACCCFAVSRSPIERSLVNMDRLDRCDLVSARAMVAGLHQTESCRTMIATVRRHECRAHHNFPILLFWDSSSAISFQPKYCTHYSESSLKRAHRAAADVRGTGGLQDGDEEPQYISARRLWHRATASARKAAWHTATPPRRKEDVSRPTGFGLYFFRVGFFEFFGRRC